MVSFAFLNEANLANLDTAAKSWAKMPAKYEGLATEFDRRVHDVLQGHWEGEASAAAFRTMKQATREYEAAADESRRTAKLIADAHLEFSKCQKDLHDTVQDAADKSYKVSDKGKVEDVDSRWNSPTATAAPGFAEERKKGLDAVVHRIEDILKKVTIVDEACGAALRKDANGAGNDNFNGKRVSESVDDAEADKASRLMKKKGRLTDGEFMQLNQLLELNKNDPEFARKFAVRTGAENTVEKYNQLLNPRVTGPFRRPTSRGSRRSGRISAPPWAPRPRPTTSPGTAPRRPWPTLGSRSSRMSFLPWGSVTSTPTRTR